MSLHMSARRRFFIVIASVLLLTACGFQLRGVTNLAFKTLFIQGPKLSIQRELTKTIKNNNITIVDAIEDADVVLELMHESNQKRILSLSGTGRVREFELNYEVNFRMREASHPEWNKIQTIKMRRDYSYNDQLLLGKGEEEERINKDMRSDAMREIVRRLSAFKVTAPAKTSAE